MCVHVCVFNTPEYSLTLWVMSAFLKAFGITAFNGNTAPVIFEVFVVFLIIEKCFVEKVFKGEQII